MSGAIMSKAPYYYINSGEAKHSNRSCYANLQLSGTIKTISVNLHSWWPVAMLSFAIDYIYNDKTTSYNDNMRQLWRSIDVDEVDQYEYILETENVCNNFSIYSILYTLYSILYTLYFILYTLYSIQLYTLYSIII